MLTLSFAIDQSSYYWSVNSVSGLCPLQMAPFWSSFIFHALTACDEGNNCRSVWKSRVDYRMRLEISFKRRKKITADKSTNSVRKKCANDGKKSSLSTWNRNLRMRKGLPVADRNTRGEAKNDFGFIFCSTMVNYRRTQRVNQFYIFLVY